MEWPVAPVMNDPPTQHRPFQQEVDLGACDSGSRGHWMLSVELQISGGKGGEEAEGGIFISSPEPTSLMRRGGSWGQRVASKRVGIVTPC